MKADYFVFVGRDPPDSASVYMMYPEIPGHRLELRTCEKSDNSNQPLDGSGSRPNSAKVKIGGLVGEMHCATTIEAMTTIEIIIAIVVVISIIVVFATTFEINDQFGNNYSHVVK